MDRSPDQRYRAEEEIKHKKAETDDKMSVRLFLFINDVKSSGFACFFVVDLMNIDEWIKNRVLFVRLNLIGTECHQY